jgi:lysophospholipase L1-like esterase
MPRIFKNRVALRQVGLGLLLSLASGLVTLAAIEGVSRVLECCVLAPRTEYEFRRRQPPPYQGAPYFSGAFVAESFRQPGGWIYPEGTRLILPKDYRGRNFNVVKGQRVTAFQPGQYQNVIYVLGGSTVYCSEVPDEFTLPSQLQRVCNEQLGPRCRVENFGTTAVTLAQQVERLRTLALAPGDHVVFYDGVNDIFQGVFYANPDETMVERNRRVIQEMKGVRKLFFRVYHGLSRRSAFARLFLNPTAGAHVPAHLTDETALQRLLESLQRQFPSNLVAADAWTRSHGAAYHHFLQPHLFCLPQRTAYENALLQNHAVVPRGLDVAFNRGYPVLRKALAALPTEVKSHDLSSILDQRPAGTEYYLDVCHVNHEANRIIAEAIFKALEGELKKGTSGPR